MSFDLLTEEEFTPTRITQKFSCPKNRIKYHNERAKEFRHSVSYITKPLLNNVRILNCLMKDKKKLIFYRQFLLGKGFSFQHFSHTEKYEGQNRYAIHEYILINIGGEDKFEIIRYKK
jgi:hypothetical protein